MPPASFEQVIKRGVQERGGWRKSEQESSRVLLGAEKLVGTWENSGFRSRRPLCNCFCENLQRGAFFWDGRMLDGEAVRWAALAQVSHGDGKIRACARLLNLAQDPGGFFFARTGSWVYFCHAHTHTHIKKKKQIGLL